MWPAPVVNDMTNLQALATEAREINAENGWGLTFNPDMNSQEIPGYLALIHSEITEAWDADETAQSIRELGDVLVRCLDLCELLEAGGLDRKRANGHPWVDQARPLKDARLFIWPAELMELHRITSDALEIYRKEKEYRERLLGKLLFLIDQTWGVMLSLDRACDPEAVIHEILTANALRAYRHGGRRT